MKRLGVAVVLVGLLVIGCGDNGLVKLENKNPTIDQAKYDLYIKALNESEFAKEYDFYHISSIKNHETIKESKSNAIKAERFLDEFKNNLANIGYSVFAAKKDNKDFANIIILYCGGDAYYSPKQCKNADEVKFMIQPIEYSLIY